MMKTIKRILLNDKGLKSFCLDCKLRIWFAGILFCFSSLLLNAQIYILGDAQVIGESNVMVVKDSAKESRLTDIKEIKLNFTDKKELKKNLDLTKSNKPSVKIKYKTSLVLKYKTSTENLFSIGNTTDKIAITTSFPNKLKAIKLSLYFDNNLNKEVFQNRIFFKEFFHPNNFHHVLFLSRPPPYVFL